MASLESDARLVELGMESPISTKPTWGADDADNPYNWTKGRKWGVVGAICLLVLLSTIGGPIYTPGIEDLVLEFNISSVVATLPLSLYVLGWSLGPLVFAPASEVWGRNIVYQVTWFFFVVFHIGMALAKNIGTLLVCRFIAGVASSAPITICAGTATDLFVKEEMGVPLGLIVMVAYLGQSLGPVIGGYLIQGIDWRWTFWFMLIATGALSIIFLWLPETYAPVLLERKNRKSASESAKDWNRESVHREISKYQLFKGAILRPWLLLFLEPVVFFMSLYQSFASGILVLYFAAYPIIFQGVYQMKPGNGSLAFLAIALGLLLAMVTAKRMTLLYLKLAAKHGGGYPEARLPYAVVVSVLLPASMFWFAWSAVAHIHWIVPIISGVLFGWCFVTLVICIMSYLTDAYREMSASVTASLVLLRSLVSMAFPLFAETMYKSLGNQWATSTLAFIAVGLMPIPFVFWKYGAYLRSKSKYTHKE